ncbi:MAG: MarR family transcriptional regulator [Acholeplasmatales bacterium]|nr:MarR family transcriptional regulator [Acholeplasmatales bacterium]
MLEEELLRAYINMSVNIKENRLLSDLSFNEIMVMNLIVEEERSFKELEERLNILKSQLNRIINDLKSKGLVETYIPLNDKRKLIIKKGHNIELYNTEHERMLKLMSLVKNRLGEADFKKLIELLNETTNVIKGVKI